MANKKRYRFTETVRSKGGRQSSCLAGVSLGLFLIDAFVSFLFGGKAGAIVGVVALAGMAFAVYGFYLGMKSFTEEKEASPYLAVLGSIASGIMAVGYLTIFLSGLG